MCELMSNPCEPGVLLLPTCTHLLPPRIVASLSILGNAWQGEGQVMFGFCPQPATDLTWPIAACNVVSYDMLPTHPP